MVIDSKTLLFDDISVAEWHDLHSWASGVILHGHLRQPEPAWIEEWCRVAQFDSRQKLLMLSTALPQRVLLSLLVRGFPTSEEATP